MTNQSKITKIITSPDGSKSCYIDNDLFCKKVNNGELTIEKEYPNEKIKKANGIVFHLMSKSDWDITINTQNTFGEKRKYKIHSNMGRFPTEVITIDYKPKLIAGKIRYRSLFPDGIDWSEFGGSMNLYSNSNEGLRKDMLIENGFTIIDNTK